MTSAPDPAASARSPVAPRSAARASVPGGPAASSRTAAGGRMSRPEGSPDPLQGGTRTSSRATPRDQALRDGTLEEVPQTPAGASGPDSPPAGSTALSGAEWRAAAKRAQSRRPPRRTGPRVAAKVTIPPPPAMGTALTAVATCLGRCDWIAGPGDPGEVDKAAEKHTRAEAGHPTSVVAGVAEIGGAA